MNHYITKKLLYLIPLVFVLLLCSCTENSKSEKTDITTEPDVNQEYYLEDGTYVVENKPGAEYEKKYNALTAYSYVDYGLTERKMTPFKNFIDNIGKEKDKNYIFAVTKKKSSKSYYKHVEQIADVIYTLSEYEILEITDKGSDFSEYKAGDLITVVEFYGYTDDRSGNLYHSTGIIENHHIKLYSCASKIGTNYAMVLYKYKTESNSPNIYFNRYYDSEYAGNGYATVTVSDDVFHAYYQFELSSEAYSRYENPVPEKWEYNMIYYHRYVLNMFKEYISY